MSGQGAECPGRKGWSKFGCRLICVRAFALKEPIRTLLALLFQQQLLRLGSIDRAARRRRTSLRSGGGLVDAHVPRLARVVGELHDRILVLLVLAIARCP